MPPCGSATAAADAAAVAASCGCRLRLPRLPRSAVSAAVAVALASRRRSSVSDAGFCGFRSRDRAPPPPPLMDDCARRLRTRAAAARRTGSHHIAPRALPSAARGAAAGRTTMPCSLAGAPTVMGPLVQWRAAGGSVNPCAPHRLYTIPRRQTRSLVYRPLIITRSMWARSQVILMSIEGALFIRPTTALCVVMSVRCELTTLPLLSPRTTCHASQNHPCGPLKLTPPPPSDPSRLRSIAPRSEPPKFADALICGNERIALSLCRSLKIEFGEAHRGNEGFEVRS